MTVVDLTADVTAEAHPARLSIAVGPVIPVVPGHDIVLAADAPLAPVGHLFAAGRCHPSLELLERPRPSGACGRGLQLVRRKADQQEEAIDGEQQADRAQRHAQQEESR